MELQEGMKVLLHLIPKDAFIRKDEHDLSAFSGKYQELPVYRGLDYAQTYNFDGFLQCQTL